MPRPDFPAIRSQLDALLRPSIAKCSAPPSFAEQCERRAAAIYETACDETSLSGRGLARRIHRCERMHRDYVDASRQIPLAVVLMLPRRAIARVAAELVAFAETLADDETEEQRRIA